jgi:hypothetical protein
VPQEEHVERDIRPFLQRLHDTRVLGATRAVGSRLQRDVQLYGHVARQLPREAVLTHELLGQIADLLGMTALHGELRARQIGADHLLKTRDDRGVVRPRVRAPRRRSRRSRRREIGHGREQEKCLHWGQLRAL